MAVTVTPNASALKIQFHCGLNMEGKDIRKTRTYNSIKPTASHEDVMAVALSLVELQKNDKEVITIVDNTTLSE